MALVTRENPYGIDPVRDLHHSPPRYDIPMWSENLLFSGTDTGTGMFFYHHLGLVAGAPDVWRGDFAVCLPDGRQYLSVTFGNAEAANVISDGTLHMECLEPLKSWRIVFDGACFATDANTNKHNFLAVDQIPVKFKFDIRWEGCVPMHEAKNNGALASGFDVRYEQAGRYWGWMQIGEERIPLNGVGYRDHSVGPRDYSKFTGHVWHWGVFDSGNIFGCLAMDEGTRLKWAAPYVVIDGELTECEYVDGPYWGPGRDDFDDKTYDFVLKAKDGTIHTIHGENLDYGYYWTCMNPSQLNYGRATQRMIDEQMWVCREVVTKWTWSGEESLGLVEISRRLGI
jgi:hypothetical protein